MSEVINDEKIPNNVNLAGDKKLQRALEAWQPSFINWWKEMGPVGFQEPTTCICARRFRSAKKVGRISIT